MRCTAPLYLLVLAALALALPACDSNEEDEREQLVASFTRSGGQTEPCPSGNANCVDTAELSGIVLVAYEGRLQDGTVFDESEAAQFVLGRVIPGFRDAIVGMRVGETKTVTIPPEEAYGLNPPTNSGIPPNASLTFDIELLGVANPVFDTFGGRTTPCQEGEANCVDTASASSTVLVAYEGRLQDGTVFDRSFGVAFSLQGVIPGFRDAVVGMRIGESQTVTIPPEEAYGENPPPNSGIPPNATLVFDVELLGVQ